MQGKPKRFYTDVTLDKREDGWRVLLDGRVLKTVARKELVLAKEPRAMLVADEWRAVDKEIDAHVMTATRLANIALDRVPLDRAEIAEQLLMFADTDLLCHRAREPELAAKQAAHWDPVLAFLDEHLGVKMVTVAGVIPAEQPQESVARLKALLDEADAEAFAGLAMLVPLLGSLLLAVAMWKRGVTLDAALSACRVDEDHQSERWGVDAEAEYLWQSKIRDMRVCARWLAVG